MKNHFWVIGAAIAAVVTFGTTAAIAASKDGPPYATIKEGNVIWACQDHSTGSIFLADYQQVSTKDPCPPLDTPLYWDIVAPQGPVGPKGDTGPQGVSGVSGYQVVQKSAKVNPGQPISVNCPSGKMVLGGGAKVEGVDKLVQIQVGQDTFAINDSQPTSNNRGWQATYGPAVDGPLTVTVWATCAKVTA